MVREQALRLLSRREAEPTPPLPEAAIERAMRAITGEPAPDAQLPFLREELALGGAPNRPAWGAPGLSNWYKGASGRVTQNWPGTHHEFWAMTRAPDPAEHDFG